MLYDQLQALQKNLENFQAVKKASTESAVYTSRLKLIRDDRNTVEHLHNIIQVLAPLNISISVPREAAMVVLSDYQRVKESFFSDTASITEPRTLREAKLRLPSLYSTVTQNSLLAWQHYVDEQVDAPNVSVLTLLDKVPAFKPVVAEIGAGLDKLQQFRATTPSRQKEVDDFTRAARKVRGAWERLDSGQIPAAVAEFLQAASSPEGAKIDLFTDEVRGWLKDRGVLEAFYVRI